MKQFEDVTHEEVAELVEMEGMAPDPLRSHAAKRIRELSREVKVNEQYLQRYEHTILAIEQRGGA